MLFPMASLEGWLWKDGKDVTSDGFFVFCHSTPRNRFYSILRFNKFFLSLLSLQNAGVMNENLIWVLMLL